MTIRTLILAFLMSSFATPLFAMGVMVHDARVQLSPIDGRPVAAYFMLMNHGKEAAKLLSVTVEGADRAEMHESGMKLGMMVMTKRDSVTIEVDDAAMFKPGGLHVMIFGLKGVKGGEVMTLTLHFEKQGDVVVEALAAAPGAKLGESGHKMHH